MPHKLISRNPDLKKLWNEGYVLEIVGNTHLFVHEVPYVNDKGKVSRGTLVTSLDLQGDATTSPVPDHVIHFMGGYPFDDKGVKLEKLVNASSDSIIVENRIVNHSFSHKPSTGYVDYWHKIISYADILGNYARAIDPTVTARIFKRIKSNSKSIFKYPDTNTARAGVSAIADKLSGHKIAIVGMGGTGSYVLDFVAKTPVGEIHIYDNDYFLTHNAYRAPGAPSIGRLRERHTKVDYHAANYSNMHKGIIQHPYQLDTSTITSMAQVDFVFICIDSGAAKKALIEKLIETDTPFVDTGIGMDVTDGKLRGTVRTTLAVPGSYDRLLNQVSFAESGDNEYSKNIQIAEVNALNASLAVIAWKQHVGYYHALLDVRNLIYNIDCNQLINE